MVIFRHYPNICLESVRIPTGNLRLQAKFKLGTS
jgi:hypothetical protein